MMRRVVLLLALLVAALPALSAAPSTEYATLLAALKAGNTAIDFARLRLSYMDSPEYKAAQDTSAAEKGMIESLNKQDFPAALQQAETVLKSDYVNIDAHFVAFVAHRELGESEKAAFHQAVFRGLIDSIRNSGDGLSPAKAWVVINVHEEYVMLRALGYMPGEQSLLHQDGHSYDRMKVKSAKDGSEQTFYFNVDIPFAHYGF